MRLICFLNEHLLATRVSELLGDDKALNTLLNDAGFIFSISEISIQQCCLSPKPQSVVLSRPLVRHPLAPPHAV